MFIKLQNVESIVPPTFLQKSFESSMIHSRWIIRLLQETMDLGMTIYDPFLGYLAAIAATTQLEHTKSKHSHIATAAKQNFDTAMRFIKKLSHKWSNIAALVEVINELATRFEMRQSICYTQEKYDGLMPPEETPKVKMNLDDAELMWKTFDYASVSDGSGAKFPLDIIATTEDVQATAAPVATHATDSATAPASTTAAGIDSILNQHLPNGELAKEAGPLPAVPGLGMPMDNSTLWSETVAPLQHPTGAFIPSMDDWSLFGEPWSAYISGLDHMPII